MYTEILSKLDLSKAVKYLKNGSLVIFPTETVYGLGANLFDPKAIEKVYEVKKRPSDNPLIAHIGTLDQATMIAEELCDKFFLLAKNFWPGPLTLIVKKKSHVPTNLSTIAIRMPSHPIALELIRTFGGPLVAPSANLSGKPSPTRLKSALEDLDGLVPAAIEGGACDIGIESTVLSLVGAPTLLRPGSISSDELSKVLKEPILSPKKGGPILSPGMKYRHYAPLAKLRLIYDPKDLKGPFIEPNAKTLYEQLRMADRQGLEEVQVFVSPQAQRDEGFMNRLLRAAGQII